MEKRWRVLDKENETAVKVLSTELNMRPVLAELLIHRDITNIEEARQSDHCPVYLKLDI